jgi:hypothetical protein
MCGLTCRSREPLVMRNPLVEENRLNTPEIMGAAVDSNLAGTWQERQAKWQEHVAGSLFMRASRKLVHNTQHASHQASHQSSAGGCGMGSDPCGVV